VPIRGDGDLCVGLDTTALFSVWGRAVSYGTEMECKVPGIEELKKVDGYLYLYENEITRR